MLGLNPHFWQGRRVLLTGHTGFKDSWLALWLDHLGCEVHGVALPPETRPNLFQLLELEKVLATHHLVDIRHCKALADCVASIKPDVVFHLAAQPLVRRSYRDPLGTWSYERAGLAASVGGP